MFEKLESVDVLIVIMISILYLRFLLYSKLQLTYRYNDKNVHTLQFFKHTSSYRFFEPDQRDRN